MEISKMGRNLKLEIITLRESGKWDKIVNSFTESDVYYKSGYATAFYLHGDGEPLLFYFYGDDSTNKAMNVVMKRDIGKDVRFAGEIGQNIYYDLATPYGYGGLICEADQESESFLADVNCLYVDYCKKNNIVSEFVRFNPVIKNAHRAEALYQVITLGSTVCLDLKDRETIWANITSKNRNVIRKAQKSGMKIRQGLTSELMKNFISLYNKTMDRDEAKEYYYFKTDFYDSIRQDLKENATIFYAVYENKIVAASIILFSGKSMHYHLSASDAEFRHLAPTNLILYEAACRGADNGYTTFHLGGGLGSGEDNLYRFKKAFNRQEDRVFCIGKKIFDSDMYNKLLEIREKEKGFNKKTSFFPQYRG